MVVTQIQERQLTIQLTVASQQQQIEKQHQEQRDRESVLLSHQAILEQQQSPTHQNVHQMGSCVQAHQNINTAAYQQLLSELESSARASQQIQQKLSFFDEQQSQNRGEGIPISRRRTHGGEVLHEPPSSSSEMERRSYDQRTVATQEVKSDLNMGSDDMARPQPFLRFLNQLECRMRRYYLLIGRMWICLEIRQLNQ